MSSPGSSRRRRDMDVFKLMESKHEVTMAGEGHNTSEFFVKFHGPPETSYEGGVWRVFVHLPQSYPFQSPSIGFMNRIFHPNIDEKSGAVCLDVINQSWTALYDLSNIFDIFLPQLLTYPNPADPLNAEAAALYLHRPNDYKAKVKQLVAQFASETALKMLPRSKGGLNMDLATATASSADGQDGIGSDSSSVSDLSDAEESSNNLEMD